MCFRFFFFFFLMMIWIDEIIKSYLRNMVCALVDSLCVCVCGGGGWGVSATGTDLDSVCPAGSPSFTPTVKQSSF